MYLAKTFTLEDSNLHTVLTFNLFIKEGKPILVESALESNGSRVDNTYDGKEDILERLWKLDLLCDGEIEVRGVIRDLRQCLIDHLYGHE